MSWQVIQGDCIAVMRRLPDNSVDAIVTDPPYGLGFMGHAWDVAVPGVEWAEECLRVLKPGGHIIAFGGTRTVHRLATAIEDGGFEVRDQISWLYWSGFPKGRNISKAIDKLLGRVREVVQTVARYTLLKSTKTKIDLTRPASEEAKAWDGWNTALKPAQEPAVLARAPLSESSVEANVLRWGTGAINVDACRYAYGDDAWPGPTDKAHDGRVFFNSKSDKYGDFGSDGTNKHIIAHPKGRWPANLYVCKKPSTTEREIGVRHLRTDGAERGNTHSTVKPIRLMEWLCQLVTPPGGLVLDPFVGSGTTGIAAQRLGFRFLGIDLEVDHVEIARARIVGDAPLLNQSTEVREGLITDTETP